MYRLFRLRGRRVVRQNPDRPGEGLACAGLVCTLRWFKFPRRRIAEDGRPGGGLSEGPRTPDTLRGSNPR